MPTADTSLSAVTIVIPTHNRPLFLQRNLEYISRFKGQPKVVVLDSGDPEFGYIPDEPTQHLLFPSDILISQKIFEGLSVIDTPYVVLCADDDFLIEDGLVESLDWIVKHEDYSGVLGRFYNHQLGKTFLRSDVRFSPLYGAMRSLENERAEDRVRAEPEVFKGSVYYALQRTAEFRSVWQDCARFHLSWGTGEFYPRFALMIQGKIKVVDTPYMTREANSFSWSSQVTVADVYPNDVLESFYCGLSESLALADGISEHQARQRLHEAFAVKLDPSIKKAKGPNGGFGGTVTALRNRFDSLNFSHLGVGRAYLKRALSGSDRPWFYACEVGGEQFPIFKEIANHIKRFGSLEAELVRSRSTYADKLPVART